MVAPPGDPAAAETITFAELLARLGYADDSSWARAEQISICHQLPGGTFSTEVGPWDYAPGLVRILIERHLPRNFWFGVNALGEVPHGRGKETDVTRLTSLYADIDIGKPGGCPNGQTAHDIVDEVSEILGERPRAITYSGHGRHPYWALDRESVRNLMHHNREAKQLIERFGRLMKAVAAHHGCEVDSVFDLARVLRVPDTPNLKDPDNPVPVQCFADEGKPITVEHVRTALTEYGISEQRPRVGAVRSDGQAPPAGEYYSRICLINRVAKAASGRRNKTLFGAALDAAKQGDLDDRMVEALEGAADECRLSWDDGSESVGKTIESAIRTAEGQGYQIDGNPFTKTRTRKRMRAHNDGAQVGQDDSQDDEQTEPDGEDSSRPSAAERTAEAEFWLQRPILVRIHQFARSRRANPYAVLGAVLRRAITQVPPKVQLPDNGVGDVVSVNLLTTNVGRSGQGKDAANTVGRRAGLFRNAAGAELEDPPSPGIGTGEGMARLFKGYGNNSDRPAENMDRVHLEIPEVGTREALADRKGGTLVGELLKVFMGQAIGFSNSQRATTTYIRAQSYRLCLGIGAQPENASFFLDREKDGLPQRFLWLPVVNRFALPPTTGCDEKPVPAVEVTIPEFSTVPDGVPYLIGVPDSVRATIQHFRWLVEIGSPDVDPLDGHVMLVRLKVAFGLALLDEHCDIRGQTDITEDDWRIAGQLMDVSNQVRVQMRGVVADRHRKKNVARAHDQADRDAIIAEKNSESNHQRVVKAITRKLKRVGTATRRELHQACDSSISRDFPAVFNLMFDQHILVAEGGEGDVTRYRLASS